MPNFERIMLVSSIVRISFPTDLASFKEWPEKKEEFLSKCHYFAGPYDSAVIVENPITDLARKDSEDWPRNLKSKKQERREIDSITWPSHLPSLSMLLRLSRLEAWLR